MSYRIDWGQLRFIKVLGEGAFGQVWEAYYAPTGGRYAVKKIRLTKNVSLPDLQVEISILREVSESVCKPFVLAYYDAVSDGRNIYILMELGKGIELFDFIVKVLNTYAEGRAGSEEQRLKISRGVIYLMLLMAKGVACLHSAGIVHRDLKPENIMVTGVSSREPVCKISTESFLSYIPKKSGKCGVKIMDFGLSCLLAGRDRVTEAFCDNLSKMVGTPTYVAPEIYKLRDRITPSQMLKTDVYSLGVIFYNLITGHPYRWTVDGRVKEHFNVNRLAHVPKLMELLEDMLNKNNAQRMNMFEVVDFLQEYIANPENKTVLLPFFAPGGRGGRVVTRKETEMKSGELTFSIPQRVPKPSPVDPDYDQRMIQKLQERLQQLAMERQVTITPDVPERIAAASGYISSGNLPPISL